MKRILILATLLLAIFATPAQAEEPVRDVCPNIYGAQLDIPEGHELKWSNRYHAYICVRQHN